MTITITDAIIALHPNNSFILRNGYENIEWVNPPENPATLEQVNNKLTELRAAEPLRLLRQERDRRLAETDWWASSDLLISDDRRKYRQALRDITKTADPQLNEFDELINVTWPEKP